MAYDIIGDIHGHADKLEAMLSQLGYRESNGAYRHPSRTAIFVGDFIDRGPRQVDSVMIVRRMVDVGSAMAVMGNHEFNAIAWHTEDPENPGEFLRPRSGHLGAKNSAQHAAFLDEVKDKPELHSEIINWFLTLPLWLDLPELRVVHACWHDGYMDELRPHLTKTLQLNPSLMVQASRKGQMAFRTIEGLTKGLESGLPEGHSFQDKDGHTRHEVRIKWWDTEATSYRDLAIMPESIRQKLPDIKLEHDARVPYDNVKPVFFGHYWMTDTPPKKQSNTAACVDYSVGKGGPLVAYCWDGEPELNDEKFEKVGA